MGLNYLLEVSHYFTFRQFCSQFSCFRQMFLTKQENSMAGFLGGDPSHSFLSFLMGIHMNGAVSRSVRAQYCSHRSRILGHPLDPASPTSSPQDTVKDLLPQSICAPDAFTLWGEAVTVPVLYDGTRSCLELLCPSAQITYDLMDDSRSGIGGLPFMQSS